VLVSRTQDDEVNDFRRQVEDDVRVAVDDTHCVTISVARTRHAAREDDESITAHISNGDRKPALTTVP